MSVNLATAFSAQAAICNFGDETAGNLSNARASPTSSFSVAVTAEHQAVLVEQYREPFKPR